MLYFQQSAAGFLPQNVSTTPVPTFFQIGTCIYRYLLLLRRGAQKLAASMVSRHTVATSLNLLSCVYICSYRAVQLRNCAYNICPVSIICVCICSVQRCVHFARWTHEAVDPATVASGNVRVRNTQKLLSSDRKP
jgi:hypothetical protein